MAHLDRKAREEIELGISDDAVFAGDHIAFFYETDEEFQRAFGFLEDIERMLAAVRELGWDTDELLATGRLSTLEPADTCEATVERVSRHFEKILATGAPFIRFIGNAAVGRDGWPAEEEFYKLE